MRTCQDIDGVFRPGPRVEPDAAATQLGLQAFSLELPLPADGGGGAGTGAVGLRRLRLLLPPPKGWADWVGRPAIDAAWPAAPDMPGPGHLLQAVRHGTRRLTLID
jgi:hypothetical protein